MLTEVPNEPTGFIKLISTMSGDGDEVAQAGGHRQARLRAGALLRRRQARPWREEGRGDGLYLRLHADQRRQCARNPAARGRLRQPVLDRQEHAGLCAGRAVRSHHGRGAGHRESLGDLRGQRQAAPALEHRRLSLQDRRCAGAFFALCRVRARRPHRDGRAERRCGRPAQRGRALFASGRRHGDCVRRTDVAAHEDRGAEIQR